MDLYSVVLFFHIVSGMGMAASLATLVVAEGSAGAITPQVRRLLNDPVIAMLGRIREALLALLVFLMTMKPGLTVTLAAVVGAVALGALSGVVLRPAPHEAGESA
ncbi:MAG: hypothetical protein M3Y30_13840 [Gemmatimonadota bacterium]|nr:hypothetical protein [Gemmatimonadota bacterium]